MRLYTRSGCGLCEEMQVELLRMQPSNGFQLELVDVDDSEALAAQYGHMVPVLTTSEGEEICHYFLDLDALAGYFSRG